MSYKFESVILLRIFKYNEGILKEGPYQDRPPLCPFRLLPLLIYSGSMIAFLKFQRVQSPKI